MAAPTPAPQEPSPTSSPSSTTGTTTTAQLPPGPANPQISNLIPDTALKPLLYGALLICPILLLLPPRKLDMYTFALGGAWIASAQEVAFGETRRRQRATISAGGGGGGRVEAEEKEDVGGVKGMFRRAVDSGGRGGETWKEGRKKEVERREEEVGEKGYGGVIVGEVREALGRDRETGERKGRGA